MLSGRCAGTILCTDRCQWIKRSYRSTQYDRDRTVYGSHADQGFDYRCPVIDIFNHKVNCDTSLWHIAASDMDQGFHAAWGMSDYACNSDWKYDSDARTAI